MGQKLKTFLRRGHGSSPLPWFTLGLSGLCLALFGLFGPLSEILVYDREAIAGGELWRLVTGHLVHVSFAHMLLNVAAFFPLAWFLERGLGCSATRLLGTFFISILVLDAWLFFGLPELAYYSGLSAYLNTLWVLLMLVAWDKSGHKIFLLFVFGDAAKIAFEGLSQTSIFTAIAWPPVATAHAVGFAVGLVLFYAYFGKKPSAFDPKRTFTSVAADQHCFSLDSE